MSCIMILNEGFRQFFLLLRFAGFILVASLITCTRSHPTVPGIDIWPRSSNENYQNAKDRPPELSERSGEFYFCSS